MHYCVCLLINNRIISLCLDLQIHQGKTFCTEYEKSKAVADKIALQAAADGTPIVLVYPGVIYGPGKLTAGNVIARIVSVILHALLYWFDDDVFMLLGITMLSVAIITKIDNKRVHAYIT